MDSLRAHARRELVFFALGVMDVCVIGPLFAALISPMVTVKPWPVLLVLLGTILSVHYLARLTFAVLMEPWPRAGLMAAGMVMSGLLVVHQTLHAQLPLWHPAWLVDLFANLRRKLISHDLVLFLSVVFLWWRGLVLAQRRLDSRSVAFRFRLGVVLLAATTAIGGSMLSWPYYRFVFLFFFASLLGIALARAEEVGRQYGGRRSPFNLGWFTTLVIASIIVLLLAAGLASLLTGDNIVRVLTPVVRVLQFLLFVILYALAWAAQFLIRPLMALLQRYEVGEVLESVFERMGEQEPPTWETEPREPIFTPEQLAMMRSAAAIGGALLVLLLVAISLHRLRTRSGDQSDEERESVWGGVNVGSGLENLLKGGRRRVDDVTDALARSRLGRLFAALTIRRIYAHLAALATERGYPRALDETPYDYLPTLKEVFSENVEDVVQITESYVAVHYGELPERAEELAEVRAAWLRIRQGASGGARSTSE